MTGTATATRAGAGDPHIRASALGAAMNGALAAGDLARALLLADRMELEFPRGPAGLSRKPTCTTTAATVRTSPSPTVSMPSPGVRCARRPHLDRHGYTYVMTETAVGRGNVAAAQGRRGAAERWFRRVVRGPRSDRWFGYLAWAETLFHLAEPGRALEVLRDSVADLRENLAESSVGILQAVWLTRITADRLAKAGHPESARVLLELLRDQLTRKLEGIVAIALRTTASALVLNASAEVAARPDVHDPVSRATHRLAAEVAAVLNAYEQARRARTGQVGGVSDGR